MSGRTPERMKMDDIAIFEKWDLADFWSYCDGLKRTMNTMFKEPVDLADDDLPLPNQAICYAYAAATWKRHRKRVDRENDRRYREERFKADHPKVPFQDCLAPGFKPSDFLWISLDPFMNQLVKERGFDTVERFLAVTESELIRIPGVGRKRLAAFRRDQDWIRTYSELLEGDPLYFQPFHRDPKSREAEVDG